MSLERVSDYEETFYGLACLVIVFMVGGVVGWVLHAMFIN